MLTGAPATCPISAGAAIAGDRYLVCSDLASRVRRRRDRRRDLGKGTPDEAADTLVGLALRAGAPDNVTLIVADGST